MADIAAVGKRLTLRSYGFWQRTRCALARMLRDVVKIAPDLAHTSASNYFSRKADEPHLPDRVPKVSERHVFTLTGVQEGEGGCTRETGAACRAAGAYTQFFTQAKGAHCPPFAARHVLYAPTLNALMCAVTDASERKKLAK